MNKLTRMVTLFLMMANLNAAPTELGNGNDGKDLLEFREINEGAIYETRAEAVTFLSKINLRGIQGLGFLKDEVEKTKLLIAREGLSPQELLDLGAFKTGNNPVVYARTFPRPHAPTRFFPAANELSRNQLISLHIHEGLHRALPASIRTNEQIVEEITKVITSPNSTFEDIVVVMDRNLPLQRESSATQLTTNGPEEKWGSFFVDNNFRFGVQSFSDNAVPIWSSATTVAMKSTLIQGSEWNLQFQAKYFAFSNSLDEQGSSDKMIHFTLRTEKESNPKRTWGYQITRTGWLHSNVNNNPLSRDITTLQVDLKRRYDSFSLVSKFYFSGLSSTQGSIELLKDPNLTVEDRDFSGVREFTVSGRDIYAGETDFGQILSISMGAQKSWSDKLSTIVSIDAHKMNGYTSISDENITVLENGRERNRTVYNDNTLNSIPALFVASTELNYIMGEFSLNARYFRLLNLPTNDKIGEITLTNLGDPMGRGIGKQSFSLSASYHF
ncbi:MAG: hypothetical protein NXH75_04160 [Halobacteriovoraceae bacterium]|nr:hypothetical protein [Halobacteriovoraceae bacterium]